METCGSQTTIFSKQKKIIEMCVSQTTILSQTRILFQTKNSLRKHVKSIVQADNNLRHSLRKFVLPV